MIYRQTLFGWNKWWNTSACIDTKTQNWKKDNQKDITKDNQRVIQKNTYDEENETIHEDTHSDAHEKSHEPIFGGNHENVQKQAQKHNRNKEKTFRGISKNLWWFKVNKTMNKMWTKKVKNFQGDEIWKKSNFRKYM